MIVITVNRMAQILGVPTPDEMAERLAEAETSNYHDAYMNAREDGFDEEEAEEKALAFEEAERTHEFESYVSKLVSAFEEEAGRFDLNVEALSPGRYKVFPKTSWGMSAVKVRVAVNGIAGFCFSTTKEFLDSGPYTARAAVQNHLGYLGRLWDLYGYSPPSQRVLG